MVPPLDAPDADHHDTLFLIADDRRTLASRVRQLLSGTTWAENPRAILVRTGYGLGELAWHAQEWPRQPDVVTENLQTAVDWILKDTQ